MRRALGREPAGAGAVSDGGQRRRFELARPARRHRGDLERAMLGELFLAPEPEDDQPPGADALGIEHRALEEASGEVA